MLRAQVAPQEFELPAHTVQPVAVELGKAGYIEP